MEGNNLAKLRNNISINILAQSDKYEEEEAFVSVFSQDNRWVTVGKPMDNRPIFHSMIDALHIWFSNIQINHPCSAGSLPLPMTLKDHPQPGPSTTKMAQQDLLPHSQSLPMLPEQQLQHHSWQRSLHASAREYCSSQEVVTVHNVCP